jgi:hypothetical protein
MFPWVLVIAFTGTILVAVYWAGVGRPLIVDLAKLALAGVTLAAIGWVLVRVTDGHAVSRVLVCVGAPMLILAVPSMGARGDRRATHVSFVAGFVLAAVGALLVMIALAFAVWGPS